MQEPPQTAAMPAPLPVTGKKRPSREAADEDGIVAAPGVSAAGGTESPSPSGEIGRLEHIVLSSTSWIHRFMLPRQIMSRLDFGELWRLRPKELGTVQIYGRHVSTPRYHRSYGHDYAFSGVVLAALPLPAALRPLVEWANSLVQYGGALNGVLVNWYESGEHYIGAHSDDEKQLVVGSPILSVSLGATRKFRVRDRGPGKAVRHNIDLKHGTCLVMGGDMQKQFTHEVPKISGAKGRAVGRRINITMRAFADNAAVGGSAKKRRAAPAP